MSRCRESVFAISVMVLVQTPMMARPNVHHMHMVKTPASSINATRSKSPAPSSTKASSNAASSTASTNVPAADKLDTGSPTVQTQPAVVEDDNEDFKAPQGALYTTSDECG